MNALADESDSLASWMLNVISITGIAIGAYYLVFDLAPSLYSGWVGWGYLQSSADKLGTVAVSILFLSLALLISGGICLGKRLRSGITLLRCFAWMWLCCSAILIGIRVYHAIIDAYGIGTVHQRITLVTGIVSSLAFGLLYSVAVLLAFRRREIMNMFSDRSSAFEVIARPKNE